METEKKIKDSLLKLKEWSNIIIIAHRPSTYKIADRIIYLEKGRIKKLLERDKKYKIPKFGK